MSETQQRILQEGMRKLIEVGISKDELDAGTSGSYSGKVKQWITLDDFKKVFPDTLTFTFRYQGNKYTNSLYEVWEFLFMGGIFDDKLFDINKKIQTFKDALKDGKNPYTAMLEKHFPAANERFLEEAKIFASQFIKLADNNMFTGHYSDIDLANRWHIYLMSVAFDI